jgi:transcriptional regulator with XRE-family HTH domain
MRQFHEIIDERRRDLDLTVEQVQERLEKRLLAKGKKSPAPSTVGHWFNGTRKRPRNMEHLRELCEVLDLQVGEAFGDKPLEAKTELEQAILKKARPLSPTDQELVIAFMARLGKSA